MTTSMVVELHWQHKRAMETAAVRKQAGALLDRLVRCRRLSEQTGRADPIEQVTGTSAIDGAILATRRIVAHTDELLREMETE